MPGKWSCRYINKISWKLVLWKRLWKGTVNQTPLFLLILEKFSHSVHEILFVPICLPSSFLFVIWWKVGSPWHLFGSNWVKLSWPANPSADLALSGVGLFALWSLACLLAFLFQEIGWVQTEGLVYGFLSGTMSVSSDRSSSIIFILAWEQSSIKRCFFILFLTSVKN